MLKEVRAEVTVNSDEDSFFIGELFLRAATKSKPNIIEESGYDIDWDVKLLVNGSPVDFKIDTTVMTEMTFNKLQQRPQLNKSKTICTAQVGKSDVWVSSLPPLYAKVRNTSTGLRSLKDSM